MGTCEREREFRAHGNLPENLVSSQKLDIPVVHELLPETRQCGCFGIVEVKGLTRRLERVLAVKGPAERSRVRGTGTGDRYGYGGNSQSLTDELQIPASTPSRHQVKWRATCLGEARALRQSRVAKDRHFRRGSRSFFIKKQR